MRKLPKQNPNSEIPSQLLDLLDSPSDKERVSGYFNVPATKSIRKLITLLLENRIELSRQKSESPDKYGLPAWAEYQADQNGYRRAFKEIIDLLNR